MATRVLTLLLALCITANAFVEPTALTIANAFHIVGIPGVKRNARVDVSLGADNLRFRQKDREVLSVPYGRVTGVQVLDGTRTYGKATYASVLAFGLPGLLVMAKKRHVDTLLIDYTNDRGGQMGLIVQVPAGQGFACRNWLRNHSVQVEESDTKP